MNGVCSALTRVLFSTLSLSHAHPRSQCKASHLENQELLIHPSIYLTFSLIVRSSAYVSLSCLFVLSNQIRVRKKIHFACLFMHAFFDSYSAQPIVWSLRGMHTEFDFFVCVLCFFPPSVDHGAKCQQLNSKPLTIKRQ